MKKDKPKDKRQDKSFLLTGDNLTAMKARRLKRNVQKLTPVPVPANCDCNVMHLTKIVISYAPKSRKRGASNIVLSMSAWGTTGQRKRMKLPSVKLPRKLVNREKSLPNDSNEFFKKLEVMLSLSCYKKIVV